LNKKFYIVISAPSGTGKTSLCRALMERHPSLRLVTSHTTRAPREGEVDGREYHFVSLPEFRRKIAKGEFLEWVEHHGNFYGTCKSVIDSAFLSSGEVLFDVEPRGAKALKEFFDKEGRLEKGIFVFIKPPSLEELARRLQARGSESNEQMLKRLAKAKDELLEEHWYDHTLVNDNFAAALAQLEALYRTISRSDVDL